MDIHGIQIRHSLTVLTVIDTGGVEHGSFTPLILSATGVTLMNLVHYFYRCLLFLLSEKWSECYAVVMGWLVAACPAFCHQMCEKFLHFCRKVL